MRRYTGVVVRRPLAQRSFTGAPQTDAQRLEMTEGDVAALWSRLTNLPLCYNHQDTNVIGRVVRPFRTAEGDVAVEIELNDSLAARALEPQIVRGLFRGLSLKHNRETLEPLEVSLCDRGAREGTWLEQQSVPVGDKSVTQPLPPRSAIVCASWPMNLAQNATTGETQNMSAPGAVLPVGSPMSAAPTPTAAAAGAPPAASAAPQPVSDPMDAVEAVVKSGKLPEETAVALLKQVGTLYSDLNAAKQGLEAAQAQLGEKKAGETEYLRMFHDAMTRMLALAGVKEGSERMDQAMQAAQKNDLHGYMRMVSAPIVAASASLDKMIESQREQLSARKRVNEDNAEKDSMYAFFQAYKQQRAGAGSGASVIAGPNPALVAASAPVGAGPAQPQAAPSAPRGGGLAPAVESLLAAHRGTRSMTLDLAAIKQRAERVQPPSAFI